MPYHSFGGDCIGGEKLNFHVLVDNIPESARNALVKASIEPVNSKLIGDYYVGSFP